MKRNKLNDIYILQMKTKNGNNSKKKKIIVGTVGSAVIVMLAVLFTRSLKQLQ